MTPAVIAKQAGLKGLAELVEITKTSKRKLEHMFKSDPERFNLLCEMAVLYKAQLTSNTNKPA